MDNPILNYVIRPEPHVFEDYKEEVFQPSVTSDGDQSLQRMLATQPTIAYITEEVTYPETGGIMMKYKGVDSLRQGFVFPEAMDGINNLKRVTVMLMSVVKSNGHGVIRGRIGAFLANYCRVADWMFLFYEPSTKKVMKIYLKPERYRQSVREIIKFINNFISNLGIKVVEFKGASEWDFGKTVGTMIEYDNAYHWRIEDIFSETSKERILGNPRKEIKRLLDIYRIREKSTMPFKAEAIGKTLGLLLLIPRIKKAFKKAIESIDVEKMKMTEADRYYTLNYQGYEFEGKTIEQRQPLWLEMTKGIIPPRVSIPIQH